MGKEDTAFWCIQETDHTIKDRYHLRTKKDEKKKKKAGEAILVSDKIFQTKTNQKRREGH